MVYKTMEEIGAEKIWRNDRFWLAADHVVGPKVYKVPKVQALIRAIEKAKTDYKMTEYQGVNYTIMHTEFVRERVEPGCLFLDLIPILVLLVLWDVWPSAWEPRM
jgi:homoaconitase/3-isopropylmalate dehydratase large subunit